MSSPTGRPSSRRVWAALLLSIISACAEKSPPGPRPTAMTPNSGPNDIEVRVTIFGEGLTARFVTDFNNRSETAARDDFRAFLGETELRDVVLQSSGSLHATVPLGLAPGKHTLTVEDPVGARGELTDAFEVLDAQLIPRALVFTSSPPQLRTGKCSPPVTVELRTGSDQPIAAQAAITVSLSAAPLRFFTDATCTTEVTSVDIAAGAQSATFHIASVIAGTFTATATGLSLKPGALDVTILTATTCLSTDPDGTPCEDGNACTTGDACQGGSCQSGAAVVCAALSPCHDVGTCSPITGACSNPAKSEGSSCEDGLSCTTGETCRQGVCGGSTQFSGCMNTAPVACLSVTPTAAALGTQRTFSASCSRDLEDPPTILEARFDFDGNNTFDTPFGALQATTTLNSAGVFRAQVEVRDDAGTVGYATRYVAALAATEDVVVTTAADENDANATPLLPGGTGLSFREAVAYANQAAGRTVRFSGAMSISVNDIPRVTANNFAIVGEPGVSITFTQAQGGNCVQLDGTNNKLIGVKLAGCPGAPLDVGGANAIIADNDLRGANPIRLDGDGIQFLNNDVHDIGGTDAVRITAPGIIVDGNRIHDNAGTAITIVQGAGTNHLLQRNVLFRNGGGVSVENGISAPVIRHNVFDSNAGDAVQIAAVSAPAVILNNIFSRNSGFAIRANAATANPTRPNLLFRNTGSSSSGADAGISADPLFAAADAGDLRIRPESRAVDAALDAGVDLNGTQPGLFNGAAPDLGAYESP